MNPGKHVNPDKLSSEPADFIRDCVERAPPIVSSVKSLSPPLGPEKAVSAAQGLYAQASQSSRNTWQVLVDHAK